MGTRRFIVVLSFLGGVVAGGLMAVLETGVLPRFLSVVLWWLGVAAIIILGGTAIITLALRLLKKLQK